MLKQQCAVVKKNTVIAENIHYMELETTAAEKPVRPGQFVHIQVPGREDLLLRRPISINTVDKESGTLSLVIQSLGEGTQALCKLDEGTHVDMIGPVGKGFILPESAKRAAVVGGGIGVAPLRYIMERWPQISYDAYLGFRSKELAYQLKVFETLSEHLYIACDDGSVGEQGFVTDILKQRLTEKTYDVIFACGPTPMLKALKTVMQNHKIPCQVSLEERMGCGIGACKVCVCETMGKGDKYKKVCSDGPVFDIDEVVL